MANLPSGAKDSSSPPTPPQGSTSSVTIITLDIAAVDDRHQAEEAATQIESLIPLTVRLVEQGHLFHLRAGMLTDITAARQYSAQLKNSGFPDCRVVPYEASESVIAPLGEIKAGDTQSRWRTGSGSASLHPKRRSTEIPERALKPYGDPHQESGDLQGNEHPEPPQQLITEGWQSLKQGNLDQAQQTFERALTHQSLKPDALYGLANVAYQRKQYAAAADLLGPLADRHYRRRETLPLLTASLFEHGELDRAREAAQLIPDTALREHWNNRIVERQVRTDMHQALAGRHGRSGSRALIATMNRNSAALAQCVAPDQFFRMGQALLTAGQRSAAYRLLERMLSACPKDWNLRKGILHVLAGQPADGTALRLVDQELARAGLPQPFREDLSRLRMELLRARAVHLATTRAANPEMAPRVWREILHDHPEDTAALSGLAWWDFERGNYDEAIELFDRLNRVDPADKSAHKGLVLSLIKAGKLDRAEEVASRASDPELLLEVLHAELYRLPPDSPDVRVRAQQIIALRSDDPPALTALAWWYYRHRHFEASERIFRQILASKPTDSNALEGLVNTLIQLNRLEEALRIIGNSGIRSASLDAMEAQIYRKQAEHASRQGDDAGAERALHAALARAPGDPATEEWLGWSIYRQGDKQRALDYFRALYTRHPSVGSAKPILGLLDEGGDLPSHQAFLETLEQGSDPTLRTFAAERRFAAGDAVRAATVDERDEAPYANADAPWGGADFFYRERFGEVGTYRLHQIGTRLSYVQPTSDGTLYGISLIPQDLSSGRASSGPSADPLWITNRVVVTPYLSAERRGKDGFRVALGTTPLNGPISPLPIAEGQLQGQDWFVGVHQLPVNQTMLSFIGQHTSENPQHPWGRVLRSGLVGGKTFVFSPGYWLSVNARYDYYWGENVWANHAVDGTLSAGKSFYQEDGTWTVGLFLTNMHYAHNTNFFTYGHGGYYSPNWMIATGPTASYELHPRADYWLKADSSVNWFRTDETSSPVYPIGGATQTNYAGNAHSGIGYFFQLQGRQLITPYLDWGIDVRYLRSAAFSDWNLVFGIRAFLEPHNSPWPLPSPVPQVYAAP